MSPRHILSLMPVIQVADANLAGQMMRLVQSMSLVAVIILRFAFPRVLKGALHLSYLPFVASGTD